MKHSESIIPADRAPRSESAAGFQSALCAALLLLMTGIAVGVDFLSRSEAVGRLFNDHYTAIERKLHRNFDEHGQLFDSIDYMWLNKFAEADYSRGGVELFGSSLAHTALRDWALPADQRALVHNYGYNGLSPASCADFIRYLIKYRGLLEAGPEKTLIIQGLGCNDIGNSFETRNFFQASVLRSGLYTYDSQNGIVPVPMNAVQRWIKWEEFRCRSFLLATADLFSSPDPTIDPKMYRRITIDRLGPNWRALMLPQMLSEAKLLDELKSRGVNVIGVIMPRGSWTEGIPAYEAFSEQMKQVFADHGVPLIDYSRAVPDWGFMDTIHCSSEGEAVIHGLLMKIALDFLHRTRALPESSVNHPL